MRDQKILIPPQFLESAEVLPRDVKSKLIRILRLLSKDLRHPSLQCKKVKGSKADVFECRVDRDVRLIYDCIPGAIRCWYIGEHNAALRFAEDAVPSRISVDDIEVERPDDAVFVLERFMLFGEEPALRELDLSILDNSKKT